MVSIQQEGGIGCHREGDSNGLSKTEEGAHVRIYLSTTPSLIAFLGLYIGQVVLRSINPQTYLCSARARPVVRNKSAYGNECLVDIGNSARCIISTGVL